VNILDVLNRSAGFRRGYQMPRPMSTMPTAIHPNTPTEIMVSSVMCESAWFEGS
jgi:hypothetical protein